MSWKDFADDGSTDDTPAITLGDLRDGESVELVVNDEPEQFDSDKYGPGIRVPAEFIEGDVPFQTKQGDDITDGDEVTLLSWSKRLAAELAAYDEESGLVDSVIEITKHSGADRYDTRYTVEGE
jgi:hypothetical protein